MSERHSLPVVNGDRPDASASRAILTEQIPIVTPVRERVVEFGSVGDGDCRDEPNGRVHRPIAPRRRPSPGPSRSTARRRIRINANRISLLIPKPGEVEHWTYVNGGGGWDHPIHLHFEEGVTIDRGGAPSRPPRSWCARTSGGCGPAGRVKFQVQFGEYGGSYVNHCHNTVHEDFAMLMRIQLLTATPGDPDYKGLPHFVPTRTPIPSPRGVTWKDPEILPEADPRSPNYIPPSGGGSGTG